MEKEEEENDEKEKAAAKLERAESVDNTELRIKLSMEADDDASDSD